MLTIKINDVDVQVKEGTTILQACEKINIHIPTLCHLDMHSLGFVNSEANCRVCMVELAHNHKLVPACNTLVKDKMEIRTDTPRVIRTRRTNIELLLSNHPTDCLVCERNGNCELQDLAVLANIKDIRFLMAYVLRGIEYEKVMEKANQLNEDGFFTFTFTKALREEKNNDEILNFLGELGENEPSLVIFHGSPKKNLEEFEKFEEKIKNSDKNLYFSSFEDRKFDDLINEFKEKNIGEIKVIPFLIIAGNHVSKDIEGEKENSYKKVFKKNMIEINIVKKSLILYDKIAEIFVEKLEK